MTAFNVVRFRVKPGREDDFLQAHKNMKGTFPGARRFSMIKTGDGGYCIIGEWDNFSSIVEARPNMIANLDGIRDMLMDFGMGVGLTDPISGDTVIDMWAGKPRAAKAKGARKAKAKKRAMKKTKKKTRRK